MRRTREFAAALAVLAAAGGCASFAAPFPKFSYDRLVPIVRKLRVDYEAAFVRFGTYSAEDSKPFQLKIQEVLDRCELFDEPVEGTSDREFHFYFELENQGNFTVATITNVLSALTLTILPGYAHDQYRLKVVVLHHDRPIKTYHYQTEVETWTQLFLVVTMFSHWPDDVIDGIMEDMVLAFLHQAYHDGILR